MSRIAALSSPIEPITAAATGGEVYQRFKAEPDTLSIAVVDDDLTPIGLIERGQFMLKMGSTYGRPLYEGRSATLTMETAPLIVDADTPIADFMGEALAERPSDLLRGFVVVSGGRYAGVGSALSLLQAAHERGRQQAADLIEANEEARRAVRDQRQALEAAELANLAKSTFLATMSHEIRTPLNGVLGMAQAMAMDEIAPVQRERLEVIRRSGEALLVILNDVLDLSKIEAGKMELECAEFDIEELARGVGDLFASVAEAKACRFVLTVDPAAVGVYRGDPTRLRQILYNLVSNALKFTSAGEVNVKISGTAQGLELRIRDTGIGMSEDQIAVAFSKFQQADTSTTRRFGGTGLGLAICRELAHLMGGSISVQSRLGEGSEFTVVLPLPRARDAEASARGAPEPNAAAVASGRPVRVLAAEDNEVNQLVLKALFQNTGIEPFVVENGVDAVAAWEAEHWDVILMDVQMPRMDGPAATRIIRERERASGRERTPIIALTANAMSHHVADYMIAGMDDFVAKPIEVGRLFAALESALQPKYADPELAA
jgi:signal transduction histidine kinase/ActR/RegA family two-component response regulator